MKISEMKELLGAEVLCCENNIDREVYSACGCDLMSDVLAYVKDQAVLLTGLVNPQVQNAHRGYAFPGAGQRHRCDAYG